MTLINTLIHKIQNIIFNVLKFLVSLYKKFISPLLGHNCRFHPVCSTYYLESLKYNGIIKGHILFLARLLHCNPFCLGGIDYPRKNVTIKECIFLIFKYKNNEGNSKK